MQPLPRLQSPGGDPSVSARCVRTPRPRARLAPPLPQPVPPALPQHRLEGRLAPVGLALAQQRAQLRNVAVECARLAVRRLQLHGGAQRGQRRVQVALGVEGVREPHVSLRGPTSGR
eukprot:6914146-Prymnesium_polylepis.1